MSTADAIRVRVAETQAITPQIKRLKLVSVTGSALPHFSGGAHTVVTMQDNEKTVRNPYSLMSSPFDASSYEISVLRVPNSRGGSIFIHDRLHEGSEVDISYPVNLFPLDRRAKKHLLIAGGIGITPFMAMMMQATRENMPFELHYGMKSPEAGAYWQLLKSVHGPRVKTYFESAGEKVPITCILDGQPLGTHLYVCGPAAMIDWVLAEAHEAGWPEENLHYERFSAPPPGKPFEVELTRAKRTITVGSSQSILEAIEAAGLAAPYLCRGGACGQCETKVTACSGTIEHNDHFLSDAEKASGTKIMICVSRTDGGKLGLDL